jgi:hypothetical protein
MDNGTIDGWIDKSCEKASRKMTTSSFIYSWNCFVRRKVRKKTRQPTWYIVILSSTCIIIAFVEI